MRIAVVGSGISGLACAHYLHRDAEVQVFEASARPGGHTATVDVSLGGKRYAIDTGFIVYNERTYPNFIALLDKLGVATQPTSMSFSLSDHASGLEYAGTNLNTLFAQRGNLVSPRFLGMIRDILRFNRRALQDLEQGRVAPGTTLGEYLSAAGYGRAFTEHYLVPMGAAIWSAELSVIEAFPLEFFVRFFHNHGLLALKDRPRWRVIQGGSREYLRPLCAGFAERLHLASPVRSIRRMEQGVRLELGNGDIRVFDHVVLACHSDQALALLDDPTAAEREVLGAIPYQRNEVVLHTDERLLPRRRRAWSSWNYQLRPGRQQATLTYNMNMLQGIDAPHTFCVTLNDSESINPHKVLGRFEYDHPVFTLEGMAAQQRWREINGQATWYCGAYWRNGFHEDGVVSAKRVADGILAGDAAGWPGAQTLEGSAA